MPLASGELMFVKDEGLSSSTTLAPEEYPFTVKVVVAASKSAAEVDMQNNVPLNNVSMTDKLSAAAEFAAEDVRKRVTTAWTEPSQTADVSAAAASLNSAAALSCADDGHLTSAILPATANAPAEGRSVPVASQSQTIAAETASTFPEAPPAALASAVATASSSNSKAGAAPATAVDPAAPPDGGWGWMVVFASFMTHVIIDGISYTFGVFMDTYAEYFGCGAAQASALMSTLLGVYMLSGPLAAGLIQKFGSRVVGVAGSLLAAAAFIASTYSPNIEIMLLLYGVAGGLGLGLMYMPSVISVGQYFEKKRAIAMGIAMSGTGFGTILFGQIGVLLLDVYDWKNTHYILAGLLLNGAVFSSLIRPRRIRTARAFLMTKRASKAEVISNSANVTIVSCRRSTDGLNASYPQRDLVNAPHPTAIQDQSPKLHNSGPSESGSQLPISYRSNNLQRIRFMAGFIWLFYNELTFNRKTSKQSAQEHKMRSAGHQATDLVTFLRKVIRIIATDLALFKDRVFLIVAAASFLAQIAFLIPYGFTVEKAKTMGASDEEAAQLLSYLGVATVVGLLGSSAIAQFPRMKTLPVHNVFLGIASLFMLVTPLSKNYLELIVCAAGYGLFIGGHVTLPPIFLCETLGLEKLNSSFGLLTLIRGIAIFIGPILAVKLTACKFSSITSMRYGCGKQQLLRGSAVMTTLLFLKVQFTILWEVTTTHFILVDHWHY